MPGPSPRLSLISCSLYSRPRLSMMLCIPCAYPSRCPSPPSPAPLSIVLRLPGHPRFPLSFLSVFHFPVSVIPPLHAGKFGTSASVGLVPVPKQQLIAKQTWSYVSRPNQVVHVVGTPPLSAWASRRCSSLGSLLASTAPLALVDRFGRPEDDVCSPGARDGS